MAREIINSIKCGFCHEKFDVATEDIEWEHINDAGETDTDSDVYDFSVSQKIKCPNCFFKLQLYRIDRSHSWFDAINCNTI